VNAAPSFGIPPERKRIFGAAAKYRKIGCCGLYGEITLIAFI
jgi:hypothetical protein